MENESIGNTPEEIAEWIRSVKFKKKMLGGVDEEDVWKKIEELNELYEKALLYERARYDTLLRICQGGDSEHAK